LKLILKTPTPHLLRINRSFTPTLQEITMSKSTITIDIHLDEQKVPEQINWSATDSTADMMQPAKSMMVAFWDAQEKAALRIDLWTKDMMVDEMADFYYQTFMGMADTFMRATQNQELVNQMKQNAKDFYQKFRDSQVKENK
jgi:gliding motility-associated protein GldC